MRSRFVLIVLIFLSINGFAQSLENVLNPGPKLYSGVVFGYNGGFGGQLNLTITNFQKDFPLSARFGIGYTAMEPGKSADARRIFINNATNGTPEERGWMWNLNFDLLIPLSFLTNSHIYLGPRYSMFTANFKYVGGNEDFDVTSNQFGLGGGLETQFPLVPNLYMVFSAGAEYFFEGTLKGHDTAYSPDGDDVNPREDYSYSDADEAVNQPQILGRFMLGINYGF
ncbi:MAG: hypothetical protein JSW63_02575 [Ignavibacterium sp.]|nr:MAG: hypothetical protein JSW63_02575 [Ignavibacterium sp.]